MALLNSPFGALGSELGIAVNSAVGAHLDFQMALLEDRQPDVGAFYKPLQTKRLRWQGYPYGLVAAPFWRADHLYAGYPKQVCLIGRFAEIDLMTGGRGIYVLQNNEAKIGADLKAWYLIDRSDLRIITQANIPTKAGQA